MGEALPARSPVRKGPFRVGSVGPKMATAGVPRATARCSGPVSPPTMQAAWRHNSQRNAFRGCHESSGRGRRSVLAASISSASHRRDLIRRSVQSQILAEAATRTLPELTAPRERWGPRRCEHQRAVTVLHSDRRCGSGCNGRDRCRGPERRIRESFAKKIQSFARQRRRTAAPQTSTALDNRSRS